MSQLVCRTASPSSGTAFCFLSPHSGYTGRPRTSTFLLRVSVIPWTKDLLSVVSSLAVKVDHLHTKQPSRQWRQHEAVTLLCSAHSLSLSKREGDHCSWQQDLLYVSESQIKTKVKPENLRRSQLSTSDSIYSVVLSGHSLFLYAACL